MDKYDDLIKQQAVTANDVQHIKSDVAEIKDVLMGADGTSGIVGWMNQSKGKTTMWGAIGGVVAVSIGVAIKAVSKYF